MNLNSIFIRCKQMRQYASIYLLQNYSTCSECPLHPSSGVHKPVTAASGTGHITYPGNNLPPACHAGLRLLPGYVIRPVPEAAVTVLCTPDDGCNEHPKHVEWFCSKWISAYCCILLALINIGINCYQYPGNSGGVRIIITRMSVRLSGSTADCEPWHHKMHHKIAIDLDSSTLSFPLKHL